MSEKTELLPPQFIIDRELSWLDFNTRVLELAEDSSIPLLERVLFLAIFSSNLDDFFMIRVASTKIRLNLVLVRQMLLAIPLVSSCGG